MTHENILNIISQANKIKASMKYYNAMSQLQSNGYHEKDFSIAHVREHEEGESSSMAGENEKLCSYSGNLFGSFLQNSWA